MAITIYGIKNCDTMKKAFKWLEANNIDYTFFDYKKEGIPEALAKKWVKSIDLDLLINKRGTTWRKLDDATKNDLNASSAVSIITENTSVVKRPLLDVDGQYHLGFKPDLYESIFDQ